MQNTPAALRSAAALALPSADPGSLGWAARAKATAPARLFRPSAAFDIALATCEAAARNSRRVA